MDTRQLSNCELTRTRTALKPHPTSKSHVVSHHSAVAMDTHIKLHHLPFLPFMAPPLHTRLNPIQSNSGIHPVGPSHFTSCWQIRLHSSVTPLSLFLPHPLHPPAPFPSVSLFRYYYTLSLLLPVSPTHPISLSLPLLSVPRQCNLIPVGPEPGA